jgi:hypothetical protein
MPRLRQSGGCTQPARSAIGWLRAKRSARQVPRPSFQREERSGACWDAVPGRYRPGARGPGRRSAGDWGEKAGPLAGGPERLGTVSGDNGLGLVGGSSPIRKKISIQRRSQ